MNRCSEGARGRCGGDGFVGHRKGITLLSGGSFMRVSRSRDGRQGVKSVEPVAAERRYQLPLSGQVRNFDP
jgi:hypothetical protein